MLSKKTRIIRALIGLAIMIAGAAFGSWWGLIGLVPFIVGGHGILLAYFLNRCSLKR